ncbi:MAG: GAF domain-containing sensor histidine kinase [Chloroflexota bacterium]
MTHASPKSRQPAGPPIYNPHELELRATLLRAALLGALTITLLYLLIGGVLGWIRPLLFPWDGAAALALCLLVGWISRNGYERGIAFGASWLVAGVNILAAFESQAYGIRHPVTALYLPGIILAGMLIGGWFLRLWTALSGLFILSWGIAELNDLNALQGVQVQSMAELVGVIAFWWSLLAVTGWLVWLFARNLERAVQIARGQTAALTHIVTALAQNPTLKTMLNDVLAAIAQQLQAQWVGLYLHDVDEGQLVLQQAYGNGRILPTAQSSANPHWQKLRETRQPIVNTDTTNDPHTLLLVPLLRGGALPGYISVHSTHPRRYRPEELELAQGLAQQVTLALQLTELAEQAQETAVLAERNRMAREIHDTLAQGFTGIVVQLENAEETLVTEPDTAQTHLERARQLARDGLSEARRSVWALRPGPLQQGNLPTALRQLVEQWKTETAVSLHMHVEGEPHPLPAASEHELLRIAQEALHNARQHAQASQITLTLAYSATHITLTVADNGHGFNQTPGSEGFGLTSMQERAAQIGAQLQIINDTNSGVTIRCTLKHDGRV